MTIVKGQSPELEMTSSSILSFSSLRADVGWLLVVANLDDSTSRIIAEAEKKMSTRLLVIEQESTGLYAAMNEALKNIRGDYFIFLNSGDVILEAAYGALQQMESDRVGCFGIRWHDANGLPIAAPRRHSANLPAFGLMPNHQGMIFPKLFSKFSYDESMTISADLDLKLFLAGQKLITFNKEVVASSLEPGLSATPLSLRGARVRFREMKRVLEKHFNPLWALLVASLYGLRFIMRIRRCSL